MSNLLEEDQYHGTDVNIAIASTITAAARIQMSFFKNNPNFNLYYSDTDSAVVDKVLPESMIGKELGLVKLEHIIKKAVFLAPKVYGFVDIDGNETIKIKGVTEEVTSNLSVGDLENLLILDNNRIFNQHKRYKNLMSGSITINDVLYNLKETSNKRSAIYSNGIFNATEPLNDFLIIK